MIDMTKAYRTRGGRQVRIYATDGCGNGPVQGAMLSERGWELTSWQEDGLWSSAYAPTQHDLLEVKKVRYLKPLRQILEENPEATFGVGGTLSSPEWGANIVPQMFRLFGEPITPVISHVWSIQESWVTTVEESVDP